jgi:BASS family bile acid:Na+ symporter
VSPLIIVIVTFGLLFVTFAAFANGLNLNISATVASLKGRALPTVAVLIANFVVVPLLVGLTLYAFDFTAQATMAFALLSVVAGAPFVAMFTRIADGDAAFAAAISLILLLVTIPFMPLVLPWLLGALNVAQPSVTTWHLLKPLLWFILLPLGLGLAVRWRYPTLAEKMAPHCGQVSLVGIALHVTLMFVAFWNDVVTELHTGEYLYSIFMPIGCGLVGYLLGLLFTPSGMRAAGKGMRLAAAIGTAQKGSQALICSLIFAMGAFSVAGVVALGSSVITILILGIVAAEIGKRNKAASTSDSAKTPADQRAER